MWLHSRSQSRVKTKQRPTAFQLWGVVVFSWIVSASATVQGTEGFSGGVTPSRFELSGEAGEKLRRSLKIYNLSNRPQQFNVRTVEWQYSEDGRISYGAELAENSCREWVRLERHRISVVPDPEKPRNFRFEIHVPDGVARQECRFAIMVENLQSSFPAQFAGGSVNVPVTGRIAVIVYVAVGGVVPQLEVGEITLQNHNGLLLPHVQVRNVGDAHGRLDADLLAKNEHVNSRLSIATSPILPGQTRSMRLSPEQNVTLSYPLRLRGKIYAAEQTVSVDTSITPSR